MNVSMREQTTPDLLSWQIFSCRCSLVSKPNRSSLESKTFKMGDGVLMACLRWIKKRKITVLLFVFSFIVSGLIINLFQLFTLPLYWINKKWFRHINCRIVYFHWCSKFSHYIGWLSYLTIQYAYSGFLHLIIRCGY